MSSWHEEKMCRSLVSNSQLGISKTEPKSMHDLKEKRFWKKNKLFS